MAEKKDVVTIDGPSGAGKSTISKLLAAKLHYTYIDTGAMYRVVGLQVRRAGLDLDASGAGEKLARLLEGINMELAPGPEGEDARAFLNGEDVSEAIRSPEMAMIASRVSAEPLVRQKLTEMQRALAGNGGIVAEGRDMGTVVLPGAKHKFFLDAGPEERARRRQAQLAAKGVQLGHDEILRQIEQRDRDDSSRALAPLRPAADAVVIDSSDMSIDAVVTFMVQCIEDKAAGKLKRNNTTNTEG